MGTRIAYKINDGEGKLVATFFSNSSHSTQFAEEVFDAALKDAFCSFGPNALAEKLLTVRYETPEGNHKAGDRIFWLVPACETANGSDCETVITVTPGGKGEPAWNKTFVNLQQMEEVKPYFIEKITADNHRPGMEHSEGCLVRYRPHESFGWLCCRTFGSQPEAEAFAATLDATGNIPS